MVLGRSAVPEAVASAGDFTERDALRRALGGLRCPVLPDVDIGHVAPQWSIVQGASTRLHWADGRAVLEQGLI